MADAPRGIVCPEIKPLSQMPPEERRKNLEAILAYVWETFVNEKGESLLREILDVKVGARAVNPQERDWELTGERIMEPGNTTETTLSIVWAWVPKAGRVQERTPEALLVQKWREAQKKREGKI